MKKVKFSVFKQEYNFSTLIGAGQEINLNKNPQGLIYVKYYGSGEVAVFNIGTLVEQIVIVNQHGNSFRAGEGTEGICLYRKTVNGNLFIKNNLIVSVDLLLYIL